MSSVSSASTFQRYYGGARFTSGRLPTHGEKAQSANQIQSKETRQRNASGKRSRESQGDSTQYGSFKKSMSSLRRVLSPCRRMTLLSMEREESAKINRRPGQNRKPPVMLKREGGLKLRKILKKNLKHTLKEIERVSG